MATSASARASELAALIDALRRGAEPGLVEPALRLLVALADDPSDEAVAAARKAAIPLPARLFHASTLHPQPVLLDGKKAVPALRARPDADGQPAAWVDKLLSQPLITSFGRVGTYIHKRGGASTAPELAAPRSPQSSPRRVVPEVPLTLPTEPPPIGLRPPPLPTTAAAQSNRRDEKECWPAYLTDITDAAIDGSSIFTWWHEAHFGRSTEPTLSLAEGVAASHALSALAGRESRSFAMSSPGRIGSEHGGGASCELVAAPRVCTPQLSAATLAGPLALLAAAATRAASASAARCSPCSLASTSR